MSQGCPNHNPNSSRACPNPQPHSSSQVVFFCHFLNSGALQDPFAIPKWNQAVGNEPFLGGGGHGTPGIPERLCRSWLDQILSGH